MAVVGMLSLVAFFVCLVILIVAAIRKKKKRVPAIGAAVFFILFVVAVVTSPAPDTTNQEAMAPVVSAVPTVTESAEQQEATTAPDVKATPTPTPEPTAKPTPTPVPTPAVMDVDYNTLFQDYQDNPINADKIYRNKLLRLTGDIDTIDREISQAPYITFNVGGEYSFNDIRMTFKKSEEDKIAALKKGQKITVNGTCTGTLLSSTVALKDCYLAGDGGQ